MCRCRRFFDPASYRIILADQRGCGASTPSGCLVDNDSTALVGDMQALRVHLGVDTWVLFGGSWGVALSLAYAIAHPTRCVSLLGVARSLGLQPAEVPVSDTLCVVVATQPCVHWVA